LKNAAQSLPLPMTTQMPAPGMELAMGNIVVEAVWSGEGSINQVSRGSVVALHWQFGQSFLMPFILHNGRLYCASLPRQENLIMRVLYYKK
jgi:hypothetical protein